MKIKFLIVFALIIAIISGCSSQPIMDNSTKENHDEKENIESNQVIPSETKGDFVYRLETEDKEYSVGTPVKIYAELEYIGEKDSITISHAASPFYFPMTEITRDIQIYYEMNQPLIKTVLKRWEPISTEYKGSGGYSDQDPPEYVEFMKSIMEGKFPVGEYVVDGFVSFDVDDTSENIIIKSQVEFIVK